MRHFLDFERAIAELEGKIDELRHLSTDSGLNIAEEVGRLEAQAGRLLQQSYGRLTPWQKVQVARHPDRPHASSYIAALISDLMPLAGDRAFGEDSAIIGGIGRFRGRSVLVLGTEKGADTESRVKHNFGMARPEGYRKARRLMRLAERFGLDYVDLSTHELDMGAVNLLNAEAIKRYQAVPVGFMEDGALLLAMADPTNILTIDDIAMITNRRVRAAGDLHRAIGTAFDTP